MIPNGVCVTKAARKKLENRRLAYDTSQAKMQKAKKEDFRVEEELRSQKVKYEEASDEVLRRMMDIKESEPESTADMSAFLEAQLNYHDKCREVLLQLKDEWPGGYVVSIKDTLFAVTMLTRTDQHSSSTRMAAVQL